MRPRALALAAAHADARVDEINWDRLAAEFSLAWDSSHDIVAALKRTFKAARFAPGRVSTPAAEAIIAETAAAHGLAIDEVMFGGQAPEYVAARDEVFVRLWDGGDGMSFNSIGRLFRMHHTSVADGIGRHWKRVGSPARRGLIAVKAAA